MSKHECLNIDLEIWVWGTSFIPRHFVVSTHIKELCSELTIPNIMGSNSNSNDL